MLRLLLFDVSFGLLLLFWSLLSSGGSALLFAARRLVRSAEKDPQELSSRGCVKAKQHMDMKVGVWLGVSTPVTFGDYHYKQSNTGQASRPGATTCKAGQAALCAAVPCVSTAVHVCGTHSTCSPDKRMLECFEAFQTCACCDVAYLPRN